MALGIHPGARGVGEALAESGTLGCRKFLHRGRHAGIEDPQSDALAPVLHPGFWGLDVIQYVAEGLDLPRRQRDRRSEPAQGPRRPREVLGLLPEGVRIPVSM